MIASLSRSVFDKAASAAKRSFMLPMPIIDEIFNLTYKISDSAVDHICDELGKYGYVVDRHCDYDAAMIIYFSRAASSSTPAIEGELRIDRIERQFDISMKRGDEVIFPVSGNWELIDKYLQKALEA